MTKYLHAIFYIFCNSVKFTSLKLLHINSFKFHYLNFISPLTNIQLSKESKLTFGENLKIRSGVKIHLRKAAKITIGDNTFINYNSMIVSHEQIIIGRNVQIGPNVMIFDHDHDFRSENGVSDMKYKTDPIQIGDNVWIGANSVILRGTKIGENTVVGAGAIIKGEYEKNAIILNKSEITVLTQ
ncbi:maltose O-acetyltransferase [Chryseomicrobium excrementi]|uniref:Maltose O-acetyltransferase n=1 Tax=Chryseomicrobium excrementi TaxID=2041346 RepID=A0A2M9F0C7_9BACL|nr:acyltransferase [Chryseomicrobium excrementi]PJK16913.1 maltose O-acetyltransferase [Chryseomicrobium excrementi]